MKNWSQESFCNRWLRQQSKLEPKRRNTLIYCGLEQSEQELVLATIRQFEDLMNSGKERIVVTLKQDKSVGTIEVYVEDSREMS